jgi:hypothetical protein
LTKVPSASLRHRRSSRGSAAGPRLNYNATNANTPTAGSGVNWFFYTYAKTTSNDKKTDFLN